MRCNSRNSFQCLSAYPWQICADVEQELHDAESSGKPVLKWLIPSLLVVAINPMALVGGNMARWGFRPPSIYSRCGLSGASGSAYYLTWTTASALQYALFHAYLLWHVEVGSYHFSFKPPSRATKLRGFSRRPDCSWQAMDPKSFSCKSSSQRQRKPCTTYQSFIRLAAIKLTTAVSTTRPMAHIPPSEAAKAQGAQGPPSPQAPSLAATLRWKHILHNQTCDSQHPAGSNLAMFMLSSSVLSVVCGMIVKRVFGCSSRVL